MPQVPTELHDAIARVLAMGPCGGIPGHSVAVGHWDAAASLATAAVLNYRLEHFRAGNDKLWGEGGWMECHDCPLDGSGFPPYHANGAHKPSGSPQKRDE